MDWMIQGDDPSTAQVWDTLSVSSPLKRAGLERFRSSWKIATAQGDAFIRPSDDAAANSPDDFREDSSENGSDDFRGDSV